MKSIWKVYEENNIESIWSKNIISSNQNYSFLDVKYDVIILMYYSKPKVRREVSLRKSKGNGKSAIINSRIWIFEKHFAIIQRITNQYHPKISSLHIKITLLFISKDSINLIFYKVYIEKREFPEKNARRIKRKC